MLDGYAGKAQAPASQQLKGSVQAETRDTGGSVEQQDRLLARCGLAVGVHLPRHAQDLLLALAGSQAFLEATQIKVKWSYPRRDQPCCAFL